MIFDRAPKPHHRGENVLPVVYADPGTNGFYYREKMPDSVACFVRLDKILAIEMDDDHKDMIDQRKRDYDRGFADALAAIRAMIQDEGE